MTTNRIRPAAILCAAALLFLIALAPSRSIAQQQRNAHNENTSMNVHYLEIVTPDVDATCAALAKAHNVAFSEPVQKYGNARMANLVAGGHIGVRAPMHAAEAPVVRPYILVTDIEAAVKAAEAAGAEIALPPTEMPGDGKYAIYFLGGIQHGLWQR